MNDIGYTIIPVVVFSQVEIVRGVAMRHESEAAVAHDEPEASRFAREAEQARTGLVREFWLFLRDNKKWWLTPIIGVLLLVGLLLLLGTTTAAPFIYSLF